MTSQPSSNALSARWSRVSPDGKRKIVIIGAIVAFLAIALPIVSEPQNPSRQGSAGVRQEALGDLLTDTDPRKLGLSGVSQEVGELRTMLAQTRAELETLRQGASGGPSSDIDVLRSELNAQADRIAQMQGSPAPTPAQAPPAGTVWNVERPQGANIAPTNTGVPPQATAPGGPTRPDGRGEGRPPAPIAIRTVSQVNDRPPGGAGQTTDAEAAKPPALYLPSGTIVQGVMLNGLDAPTGRGATGDPIPVLIRIKHEAFMPNRFRMDVRDCHMIAAGFGDLPSERAYLRTESISCVRKDGGVIDIPVEMYAVGEDGKTGVRGTVISKQGAVLARALLAGFAEGVSNAFRPQIGFGGVGSGGGVGGDSLEAGAYGGASSSLDRISAYYLRLADQLFPVIEVSGGRPVNFVTLRGTSLQLTNQ